MTRLALPLVLALCLFALPAAAAQSVTLRADVVSQGVVTLGDIFDGAGPAAAVKVGATVRAGSSVSIDAGMVQQAARASGLEWDNAQGIRRIIVHAAASAPDTSARPVQAANLAPAGAAPAPAQAGKPGHTVQVLTYVRNIDTGEIVQADDLTWGEAVSAPAGAPKDADDLIGKIAKRPLRLGSVANSRDVTLPQVIKRDDMVEVLFSEGGVSVKMQAKAMGPAAVGDTLKVENAASKKVISAVASGPGHAVVGPEADRLRAAASSSPSSLASR